MVKFENSILGLCMRIILIILFSILFSNNVFATVDSIINNYWNTEGYEDTKKYVRQAEEALAEKDLNHQDKIKLTLLVVDFKIYEENYNKSYELLTDIEELIKQNSYKDIEEDLAFYNFYSGVSSWNIIGCEKSPNYFLDAIKFFKTDKSFLYYQLLSLFYVIDCNKENGDFEKAILDLNFIIKIVQNNKETFNEFYEDALYKLSEIHEIKGEFKKSIVYINKIITNNTNDHKRLFDLYKHVSYLNLWARDKNKSNEALIKSIFHLSKINKITQTELNISYLELTKHLIELDEYQKAEELTKKIKLKLHDKNDLNFLNDLSLNKAQILIFNKKIDQAKNLLIKVLNDYELIILKANNLKKMRKDDAKILNDLHLNFVKLGLFSEAEKSALLALKISKTFLSSTDDFYYVVLGNLGIFYEDSLLPDKTIALLKPAVKEMITLYGEDFFGLSQIYNNLGSAFTQIDNNKEALKYYKLALDIDNKVYGPLSEDTITSRNNLAHIQALNGQYEKALQNYKLNYEISLKNNSDLNPLLFNNLALAYSDVKDTENAHKMHLKAYELSKVLVLGHTDKTTIINNLITFYLQNETYDVEMNFSKKLSDELLQNLYASLNDLRMEKSLTILNYFSGHHRASLTPFLVYSRLYFKNLINLKEFQQTSWLASLQLNSFSVLDLSLQSVQLRRNLKKINVREFDDLSLNLENLNREYRKLIFNNDDNSLSQNKRIIELKNKINKFRNDNNISSGFTSLDQKKLQAQINDGKVIIKFVSDDFYLYCLLISKNKVIPIKYEKEINYYKSLFEKIDLQKQDFDFRLFKDQSHKIYTEVFLPIKKHLSDKNELSFILDDFMFNLPPQAWVIKKTKSFFNSTPLYLVEKNLITITPSLSILDKEKNLNKSYKYKFVGVGYPNEEVGKKNIVQKVNASFASRGIKINENKIISSFAPLPNTKIELEYLSKKLSSLGKTKLMISDNATEIKIKKLNALSEAEIISFSTHALINNELNNENEPSLILTPDSQNDGFLTSSEIMFLKINAKLVILSACNTASGFDNSSLGLTGLVNSFFYSGAEKVLATSWKVNDKSTMIFNKFFANNITDNNDIKKSLNSSITQMINNTEYSNPHYWAAFSLVTR